MEKQDIICEKIAEMLGATKEREFEPSTIF
jgi:hypothetical protein